MLKRSFPNKRANRAGRRKAVEKCEAEAMYVRLIGGRTVDNGEIRIRSAWPKIYNRNTS